MLGWVFLVIAAGAGIAFQMPITARAAGQIGMLRTLWIVNATGLVTVSALLLSSRGTAVAGFRAVPWYAYIAGPMGIGIMAALAYAMPRLGISSTLVLSITAQLVIGLALERVGFLGPAALEIHWTRVVGALAVAAGAWLMVRR